MDFSQFSKDSVSGTPPISLWKHNTHTRLPYLCYRRSLDTLMPWRVAKKQLETQRAEAARELIRKKISTHLLPEAEESNQTLEILLQAFDSGHHDELEAVDEVQAQDALDVMQEILRCWHSEDHSVLGPAVYKEAWRLLLRRLQRLSCEASILPSQLYINQVECDNRQIVGGGGYADVYRGTYNGGDVAVKCLRIFNTVKTTEKDKVKELVYREAMVWCNLDHMNILKFRGISEGLDGISGPCMILQWAEKKDLSRYLDDLIQTGLTGTEYVRKVHKWICQIPLGLEYLHSHDIVHGDVRAVNVLVGRDETILLADFGLSVIANVGTSLTNHYAAKSSSWMAPELLKHKDGPLRPTCESDMYSFGCVCVELFNNGPPHGELQEHEIIVNISRGKHPKRPRIPGRDLSNPLWAFVKSCWRRKPSGRPTAARAVKILSTITKQT